MRIWRFTLSVLGGLLVIVTSASGQASMDSVRANARLALQAIQLTDDIELDGRLDEAVWEQASLATGFTQREPDPGEPATRETEVHLLYDRKAIYVGARMYDDPDSIAAQLSRRDETGTYSDWFSVGLDSYNDNRSAFVFEVNPRGVKRDLFISDDSRSDLSWDAVWEVKTQIDSLGWTAEIRIPLSQLRFSPEKTDWGVNFQRYIARNDETVFWAPLPPAAPGLVSRFGTLTGLKDLVPPGRLQLEPYSVVRATRAPGDPENPFHSPNEFFASVGADVEYGLTSNLTLTGTINPDFGQVEADPAVVNLTAFEIFFPEKRPFFVEGANIFEFGLGGGGELFYSRRIGRSPQGVTPGDAVFREVPEVTTILGAAKLSGKTAGGWSIGVLDALTAGEDARYTTPEGFERRALVEPLTNYGVARVIKDFRGGESALGGILTSVNRQLEEDGSLGFLRSAAYAGGVDGRHRFGGGDYQVRGYVVGSHVQGSAESIELVQLQPGHYFQRPDAEHLDLDPELTSLQGYAAEVELSKISGNWRWKVGGDARSPGFEVDDLGFQRQADLIAQNAELGYQQFRSGQVFRRWNVELNQGSAWTFGRERVESYANLVGNFALRNYWSLTSTLQHEFSALSTSALRGGPALVTPGESRVIVGVRSDQRKPVSASVLVNASFENESDGQSLSIRPSLDVRLSPQAEFSLQPAITWNVDPAQYIGQRSVGGVTRYFLAHLDQTTALLTARFSYSFRPGLTFQFYGQPFISAGEYDRFKEVSNPKAGSFGERFRVFSEEEVVLDADAGRYQVDLNDDGQFDTDFGNPEFNLKQFRSNAVVRWEYRPGSTLFFVWNQGRRDFVPDGDFGLGHDVGSLFDVESTNVFLVKLSYWFNL